MEATSRADSARSQRRFLLIIAGLLVLNQIVTLLPGQQSVTDCQESPGFSPGLPAPRIIENLRK